MTSPLKVRRASSDDLRFIHSSWHTTFWKTNAKRTTEWSVYKDEMDQRIDRLLARSETLVATAAEVPDEILGYAVLEGDVLHFAYVKSVYRGMGIAKGLVRGRAKWYTHATGAPGVGFAKEVGMQFNPFKMERP